LTAAQLRSQADELRALARVREQEERAALRVRAAVRNVVHGSLGVAGAVQDATRGMETLARALGEAADAG